MRVLMLTADSGGCGLYRCVLPARYSGEDVTVGQELTVGYDSSGRVRDAHADADVVVLQRPTRWALTAAIPFLQARGIAVVVEMDDDFTCIDPANPTWWTVHPDSPTDQDVNAVVEACRVADLVTVSTPALARRFGRHGRVAVLPNYVPSAYLDLAADGGPVGWAGTVQTHPNDLPVTRGGVGAAVRDTGAQFRVVGDGGRVREQLGLDVEPQATGIVPLDRYPLEVARLGVGIVPLAGTAFNRAKSALKMLEYAALGVAPVGSPTPDNQRVHADGVGLLANGYGQWRRRVADLVTDEAMRAEVVDRSRQAVRFHHTIESNAWRWAEAWAAALTNRRMARPLQPA